MNTTSVNDTEVLLHEALEKLYRCQRSYIRDIRLLASKCKIELLELLNNGFSAKEKLCLEELKNASEEDFEEFSSVTKTDIMLVVADLSKIIEECENFILTPQIKVSKNFLNFSSTILKDLLEELKKFSNLYSAVELLEK